MEEKKYEKFFIIGMLFFIIGFGSCYLLFRLDIEKIGWGIFSSEETFPENLFQGVVVDVNGEENYLKIYIEKPEEFAGEIEKFFINSKDTQVEKMELNAYGPNKIEKGDILQAEIGDIEESNIVLLHKKPFLLGEEDKKEVEKIIIITTKEITNSDPEKEQGEE